ncbi:MAG TPA: dienelactone hydrolase family protein [Acidiferrobacterales bacterium]
MVERRAPFRRQWLAAGALLLAACQGPDHFLIHPRAPAEAVVTWAEVETRGDLRMRSEWARPAGPGPFPAVLVHPEAGGSTADMRGVLHDLAAAGYLAAAADYRQRIDGRFRRNLFVWRSEDDVTLALERLERHASVDRGRIGLLGFSQGGVLSLVLAAHAPGRVRAVVAYYPVTDFDAWLSRDRPNPLRRMVFRVIRWHFKRESGAQTEAEFVAMLARASPLPQVEGIRAPVLLIHGARDGSAEALESERLAARLRALDRTVALEIVPGAGHVFNFKDPQAAQAAWRSTLAWLARYLAASPAGRVDAPEADQAASQARAATSTSETSP